MNPPRPPHITATSRLPQAVQYKFSPKRGFFAEIHVVVEKQPQRVLCALDSN